MLSTNDFIQHINKKLLYFSTWKYTPADFTANPSLKKECQETEDMFSQWAKMLLKPKFIYEYFPVIVQEKKITIPIMEHFFKIELDYNTVCDNIGVQLVTLGEEAVAMSHKLYNQGKYQMHFYWHGYCASLTEALADYVNINFFETLGETKRLSFGYPALPNILDQVKIFDFIDGKKIGVTISKETGMMTPEYTTLAIVIPKGDKK